MTIPSDDAGSGLTCAQHAHVDALFDRLLDLPQSERAARLATFAVGDPAVVAEVASLLAAASACGDFLARPAVPTPATEPDATLGAGTRVGPWRVVRAIGRGGMGEVYEAQRVEGGYTQRAALKLLLREADAQSERFRIERQILARLQHSGIARLLDGGVAPDGRPYMAMEFVEGRDIGAVVAAGAASLDERLRLFVQVCDAVAYAHHHLVVHRDLKPANILVDADGQVRLLDFGVAKLLADDAANATLTRGAPLTPVYAAPEQLTGGVITTATDVYALGLLLFELLTGELPWATTTAPIGPLLRVLQGATAPLA
ncbi:MAG: serine/threonine protein kinase, partial [Pseudomonadota bacterium]|nr:serine/threonine protein kinase [Pseudomonadota bacterium]